MTTKIQIVHGDITKIKVDVIVNAANTSLLGGGGVDGAIHRAGGPEILEDCRKIIAKQGGCKVGQAVITTGGRLQVSYVIHTVGPVWNGGKNNESEKLASCYKNSLELAVTNNCTSIAFPNISTGIYKFPKALAANIAIKSVLEFINKDTTFDKIVFVCFDLENLKHLQDEFASLINSEF